MCPRGTSRSLHHIRTESGPSERLIPFVAVWRRPRPSVARLHRDLLVRYVRPGREDGDLGADDVESRLTLARFEDQWSGGHGLTLIGDFAGFDLDLAGRLRTSACRTSALKADASTSSPSWMSMARRTFPSRLELKRRVGSFR